VADRLSVETERLRTAIRAKQWRRALPISERIVDLLRPLAAAYDRSPARPLRALGRAATSDGSGPDELVPLSFDRSR
jgi:hypothetical protein